MIHQRMRFKINNHMKYSIKNRQVRKRGGRKKQRAYSMNRNVTKMVPTSPTTEIIVLYVSG